MIKVDSLSEYVTIEALKNYCNMREEVSDDCPKFKIKDVCDCMSTRPRDLDVEYKEQRNE